MSGLDMDAIRAEFPGLDQEVHGRPLVYLDSAATSQRPRGVMDAIRRIQEEDCANVHRGVHALSQRMTAGYEAARHTCRRFLNAARDDEIVFVRGTTEAINLVAQTFGVDTLKAGDEVLVSGLEHHSNIVPWQLLAQRTGCVLRHVPLDDRGGISLDDFVAAMGPRTRLVSFAHVSNALGTILPAAEITAAAHAIGAKVLIDGAQAVPHLPVDVQALDADFYAFSGHKVFGPTGIGVLYGKIELLSAMRPWQGGGDMIETVRFSGSTWAAPPARFEAGTPNFVGAVGLGVALEWFMGLDQTAVLAHEAGLLAYGTARLQALPGLRLIGTAPAKAGVLSFVQDGLHPHDIGTFLDRLGIAVRVGHHCAMPVMERMGVQATSRASLALYNRRADIDALVAGLAQAKEFFDV